MIVPLQRDRQVDYCEFPHQPKRPVHRGETRDEWRERQREDAALILGNLLFWAFVAAVLGCTTYVVGFGFGWWN